MKKITLSDIQEARTKIQKSIIETPLKFSHYFSALFKKKIFFKMENLQNTGAFKVRGATNKLLSLSAKQRKRGVITASAGNHAQGVAYQARQLGLKATIVMPEPSPMVKMEATRAYGAKVVLSGETYDEAYATARKIQSRQKLVFIHAYEDPYVIAGQGTIGLEIVEQDPDVEAVIVPIGGGGLISGVATAIKEQNPKIKVYGVQAAGAAQMADSFKQGRVVHWQTVHTMADGIAAKKTSPYTLGYIRKYVDDIVTVTDEEISSAIVQLLEKTKTLVEGAGATTLAALLSKKLRLKQKNIVCLLSGGNIDVTTLSHVIERGLAQEGRMVKLGVVLEDRPGALHQLTQVIADEKANIMQVAHDRATLDLAYGKTRVLLTLEMRGHQHIRSLLRALKTVGYSVDKF